MDAKRILKYLRQLMANNNRAWFLEHKQEYDAIRANFEDHMGPATGLWTGPAEDLSIRIPSRLGACGIPASKGLLLLAQG